MSLLLCKRVTESYHKCQARFSRKTYMQRYRAHASCELKLHEKKERATEIGPQMLHIFTVSDMGFKVTFSRKIADRNTQKEKKESN